MWKNSSERWGAISQGFHWLTVLLVFGLLVVGFLMADFIEDIGARFRLIQWHKSFGMLVLALSMLRLVWRACGPVPLLPTSLKPHEKVLAHLTHYGLYAVLFAMPIVGWLMVSASTRGIPTEVFGLFTLPKLIGPDKALHDFFEDLHEILAFVLIGLVALHAGAAFKHHFVLKDNILRRMLPGRKERL